MGDFEQQVTRARRARAADRWPSQAPRAGARYTRRKPIAMDGPFVETKELVLGAWPASLGRYASVNGLRMYYEVHGKGRPLVLLHAALSTIETQFRQVVHRLAGERQIIVIEQQAHGRTADIDRPLSCEQMADDTAELLRQLDVRQADFFGFSMGGFLALQVALQHPGLARKLAVVSSGYGEHGFKPAVWDTIMKAVEGPAGQTFRDEFLQVAGRPDQWDRALTRAHEMFHGLGRLRPDHLRSVRAHTLLVTAEEGFCRPGHNSELAKLIPNARLEMLPGDDHHPAVFARSLELVPAFLDAPVPELSSSA